MRHFLNINGLGRFTFLLIVGASVCAGAATPKKAKVGGFDKEALLIELTGKDDKSMSDVELYSEIVAAYQNQDEIGLKSRLQLMTSRHAQSHFADNALYLAGRQALENRNYGEAVRFFQRVATEYPRSNRVVSAQFSKALAYKKMNLNAEARKVFREIIQRYPGSPESFRADNEMRLLN